MDPQALIEIETFAAVLDQLDYYGVLKIPQSAPPPEIKAAYYRESRAFHPDRFAAVPDPLVRELVGRIYRRINEAWTILRDDKKRLKYLADVSGPDRASKLRFTEADEVQVKEDAKRKVEEQFGQTPNGRKFFKAAMVEIQAKRWDKAEVALKSAMMYEPANPMFKEQLVAIQAELDKIRPKGDYRIK
jgi:curved DNA-binding protein CbpA